MKKIRKPMPWAEIPGQARPSEGSREASAEASNHASGAEAEFLVVPEEGSVSSPSGAGAASPGSVAAAGGSPGDPGASGAGIRDDAEVRAADYLDQLQRLKAEFDNYRKRTAKEREDWFLHAQAEIAEALLPVLDDIRRSREHETAQEVAEPAGRQIILNRFEDLLEKLGLEKQGAEPGAEFDPEQHDAVMAEPSAEIPEGKILRVLEPGYLFRGRLLRRSRVCYSTGPAGE
jgi:molecular chaperone GrpE